MVDYSLSKSVRRVEVVDPILASTAADYADAFRVRLLFEDHEPPLAWVRRGLTETPGLPRRSRGTSHAGSSDDRVPGWHVVRSTPELVHLERRTVLIDIQAVGRRLGRSDRLFTTVLTFRRPVVALGWVLVGPVHRRMSRRLVAGVRGRPAVRARRTLGETGRASSSTGRVDYVDSFTLETVVEATPEEWARAMFGDTPDLVQRFIWSGLLGLPLDGRRARDLIAGWRVTGSGDAWLRLENRSAIVHGNLLVHLDAGRVTLATVCRYPTRLGRLVWAVLSPVHRRLVPGVLHDAAARLGRAAAERAPQELHT